MGSLEFQKNSLHDMEITGITSEGNGVGRVDGYTVFVPDTAVGDRCRVRLVKCQKTYGYGRLEELLTASPDRIAPRCPVSVRCGGCAFQHISYEAELRAKTEQVRDAFERIGGIRVPLSPILGSARIEGYRNKAQYPLGVAEDGRLQAGFYAKRSHRLIPVQECLLQPPVFGEILREMCAELNRRRFTVYDPVSGRGLVRHLYFRIAQSTGQIMVCLVVSKACAGDFTGMADRIMERFPQVKSFVLNENPQNTNVILGPRCVVVRGTEKIEDVLCGVRIALSPLSFYQVNHDQAEVLYRTALRCARLCPEDTLLDLYCGTGTIGLAAAREVRELIGVEIVPEAIEDAKENTGNNGIQNARFLCADAGTAAAQLAAEGTRPDVIVVDPPRKGLDAEVIRAIGCMAPPRLVMVSCNPATAARDAALLQEQGYMVREIIPVDLFPRTTHVETVVSLSKGGIDTKSAR